MPETISLKNFFRTGEFGNLHFGLKEEEVLSLLGKPDAFGSTSRKYRKPSVWKYGDVELFFDRETRRLWLIVINFWEPTIPSGGTGIKLDPWIIKGGLTQLELINRLDQEAIQYKQIPPINSGTAELLVGASI